MTAPVRLPDLALAKIEHRRRNELRTHFPFPTRVDEPETAIIKAWAREVEECCVSPLDHDGIYRALRDFRVHDGNLTGARLAAVSREMTRRKLRIMASDAAGLALLVAGALAMWVATPGGML